MSDAGSEARRAPRAASVAHAHDVRLVPLGTVDRNALEFLALSIREGLGLRPHLAPCPLDIADAYDARRGQYDATEIIVRLVDLRSHEREKVLGVADVDLFMPVLTFVFGQAQLGGVGAVLSLKRLRQDFYGLPASEDLLLVRAEKEAVHEIGHTFGLVHCRDYGCVMYYSNSIEEVDLKSSAFCESCGDAFRRAVVDRQG